MHFVRMWSRWLADFLPALIGDRALLGMAWPFFFAGQHTAVVVLGVTWLLYGGWRPPGRHALPPNRDRL